MSIPATFFDTYTVVAAPADATATVVATLSGVCTQLPGQSVKLRGWAVLTPGADTTAVTVKIVPGVDPTLDVPIAAVVGTDAGDLAHGMVITVEGEMSDETVSGAVFSLAVVCTGASGASGLSVVHLEARVD